MYRKSIAVSKAPRSVLVESGLEPLEPRALLTAVAWTGLAGDNLWSSPGNWSGNAVPGAADDVTIDVAADPQVRFTSAAGSRTINSLLSRENLSFEGGSLKIQTTGRLEGAIGAAMAGGTLEGGSWSYQSGASFNFFPTGGLLKDVALNADIVLGTTSASIVLQGATTFTSLRLQGAAAVAYFAPGFTISAPVIAEGTASGPRYLSMAYGASGTVTIAPTGSILLASGAKGSLVVQNYAGATLVNDGHIFAEATGQTLIIQTTAFVNDVGASVQASAGTLTLNSPWYTNSGSFHVNEGATFNLGGTFFAAGGAGFLVRDGSAWFNIVGTLNNFGSTLTTDAFSGSLRMAGGTFYGGTLVCTAGTVLDLGPGGGEVKDLTITGEIRAAQVNASVLLSGSTSYAALRFVIPATVYVTPDMVLSGLISVEGGGTVKSYIRPAPQLPTGTVTNTGTIRAFGGDLSFGVPIRNEGLISAETGAMLTIAGALTNTASGTVQAAGGRIELSSGTSTNAGTFKVGAGSIFGFSASFDASAGIGTLIHESDGTFNLYGYLFNAGNTLALDDTTGPLTIIGGSIHYGAVSYSGSGRLAFGNATATLDSVAIDGEVILDKASSQVLLQGNTTFTAARLAAPKAALLMSEGAVLNSPVTIEGADAGNRLIQTSYQQTNGTGLAVFGPDASVRVVPGSAGSLVINSFSMTPRLENYGLISCEAIGQTLTIQSVLTNPNWPRTFVNKSTGVVQVLGGTLQFSSNTYTNEGTFKVGGGATLALGSGFNTAAGVGTFVNDGTGTFGVTGTIANTGNTISLSGAGASWTMSGGAIQGGSMILTGGAALLTSPSGGTLTNVAISGEVLLASTGSSVVLAGATTFSAARLTGPSVALYLAPGATLDSLVSAEGAGAGTRFILLAYGGNGTVTFGPSAVVRLAPDAGGALAIQNNSSATLINNGLIQGQASGKVLSILTSVFTNNGTVDAAGSNLFLSSTLTTNFAASALTGGVWKASNAGTLNGGASSNIKTINATVSLDGAASSWTAINKIESIAPGATLQLSGGATLAVSPASGTFTNSGVLALGAGSTLAINGNFVQAAAASLQVQIAGVAASDYGRVTATGAGQFDGALTLTAVNGYTPARGDTQDVVLTTGVCQGAFSSVTLPQPQNPEWKTAIVYTGNGARMLTTSIIDFNNDGQLDLLDFFDFFNRWDVSDSSLDLNNDGSVDLGDYFLFFNLWDQG